MYNLIIATKVQTSCQNMIILFHVYVTQFADCTKLAIKRPCQSQFFSNFAATKHPIYNENSTRHNKKRATAGAGFIHFLVRHHGPEGRFLAS